jgi:hypothetical protein
MLKTELLPSVLLIIMGSIDCLTTVIGISYAGAREINPFMASIANSNIGAFLAVKIAGTLVVAFSYILARQILLRNVNKSTKFFKYSSKALQFVYMGLLAFLVIVVVNNLLVLIR